MELYAAIGRRIRILRKQNRMTQQELADRADISLSFLGHIERGTRKLSVDSLCRIVEALNCSFDSLLDISGSREKMKYSSVLRIIADDYERMEKEH